MPSHSLAMQSALLLAGLLLAGCANYLPRHSEQESHLERRPMAGALQIDVGDPVLDLPQRRIRVLEQKTFDVTQVEITRYYDRYTPYELWRELYEIPMGAVTLIAGLGANLINLITWGQLPERVTHGWIEEGLAGLNPFMNIQSPSRSVELLSDTQEQRRQRREQDSSLPWADKLVTVQLGAQRYPLHTDRNGILRLNLLESPFNGQSVAELKQIEIQAQIAPEDTPALATLEISPELQNRLQEAQSLILDDLESEGVQQWVFRIRRLNELCLQEEAQDLEKNLVELTRLDPELQKEFLQALHASN